MTSPHNDKAGGGDKAGDGNDAGDKSRLPCEFATIERYFAPLSAGDPLAFNLTDDAALIRPQQGMDLVVTKDACVEGVHFLSEDSGSTVARKLLRVNLSDLAAKGATPLSYVLACAWPHHIDESWIESFAKGLARDQEIFDIHLIGGDTVLGPERGVFSLTAFGTLPQGKMLRRKGAVPGDLVFVSGTLGDGFLGLQVAQNGLADLLADLDESHKDFLLSRYQLPRPRLALGARLGGLASACLDISDGLVADAGHLADVSGVHLILQESSIPLSAAGKASNADMTELMTAGDDYELLFTAPASDRKRLAMLGRELDVPLTEIGCVEEGEGITVIGTDGAPLKLEKTGYQHF